MERDDIAPFPVALNLRARPVLVIGGDEEAEQKVPRLLAAGARVTLVAPSLPASLAALARAGQLRWFVREFVASDVWGAHLVVLTAPAPERARQLKALARRHGFLLCAIDQPAYADVFLVSTLRRGPVQIAISTGGSAPLLARRLRQALERGLDARFGEFARSFAALRARVRALPKARRLEVLEGALAGFAMQVHVRYPGDNGQGAGYPPDETQE